MIGVLLFITSSIDTLNITVCGFTRLVIVGKKGNEIKVEKGTNYSMTQSENMLFLTGMVKGNAVVSIPEETPVKIFFSTAKVNTLEIRECRKGVFVDISKNAAMIKIGKIKGEVNVRIGSNSSRIYIENHEGPVKISIPKGQSLFSIQNQKGDVEFEYLMCDTLILQDVWGDIKGSVHAACVTVKGGRGNTHLEVSPVSAAVSIEREGNVTVKRVANRE